MPDTAKITVTSGPDKGRVYELSGEMIRLGRSPDNHVVFTDSLVDEQHASIVCREGRFAIHTVHADGLEIDGTEVPPERWVWLPEAATIRVGKRTSVEFTTANIEAEDVPGDADQARNHTGGAATQRGGSTRPSISTSGSMAVVAAGTATATVKLPAAKGRRTTETTAPGSDGQARPKKASADRGEKKNRTLARFITDGPGDPLVKLGEDGHLPELNLHEMQSGEKQEAGPKESNSAMLLLVLGVSFGMTILMLVMDTGSVGGSEESKENARSELKEYWVAKDETLKPYQEHLRLACRARSRRDLDAERKEYRAVLFMLRSEAKDKVNKYTGLTGQIDYEPSAVNKKSDKRLEELIAILLGE